MLFGIAMLIVIYLLWVLFVEGALWKVILFIAGPIGLYLILLKYVEGSDQTVVTIAGSNFSWAVVVPAVICVLALLTTKVKSDE